MCGIAGFITFKNFFLKQKVIQEMLRNQKHRGPDGTSWFGMSDINNFYFIKDNNNININQNLRFAFGCSRLAINDISDLGMQPISSSSEKILVCMNGEIFNFLEIKEKLKNKYNFKTKTDTEVVANAYEEWGAEAFKKFNGQFAIVILDLEKNKVIFVRDRLGIMPLYYFIDDKKFLFSSEVSAITKSLKEKMDLNLDQVARIIALPYKLHNTKNSTLFKRIKQIPPSKYFELDLINGKLEKKSYWNINQFKIVDFSLKELKKKVFETFIDSVKIRLRTDRSFAFLVSGGIDSTAILGCVKKFFKLDPTTFSLDLPDERFNENDSICEVIKELKLDHSFIKLSPEIFIEMLRLYEEKMDLPLATPNAILHMILSNSISSKNINVVLNGVGGDEVFFGYHDHFLYNLYNLKKNKSKYFESEFSSWIKNFKKGEKTFYNFCKYVESDDKKISTDFLSRSGNFDYRGLLKGIEFNEEKLERKLDYTVNEKKINDITKFTIPYSTRMDDYCYFFNSVEARQPFLDHRLVELSLQSSEKFMIRNSFSKVLLRQSLKEFIPKKRRIDKKKIGLNLPFDKWINSNLKLWVHENLGNKESPIFKYIYFKNVKKIIYQHNVNNFNHGLKIWDLCMLNTWLKRNNEFAR